MLKLYPSPSLSLAGRLGTGARRKEEWWLITRVNRGSDIYMQPRKQSGFLLYRWGRNRPLIPGCNWGNRPIRIYNKERPVRTYF